MEYRPLARADHDFQRPVRAGDIAAMARRAFGAGIRIESAGIISELRAATS